MKNHGTLITDKQTLDLLDQTINSLPELAGIYRFYNKIGTIIYVGKAKNLKKRVKSYFTNKNTQTSKTRKLVSEISRIEVTIAPSEFEALLLENNFIKQYQPKYNILLKDDKTFPYLCIVNEQFPRIISTRKYIKGYGEYFGPYASVVAMKRILEFVQKLHSIRTCSLLLSSKNIEHKKFKRCLEFHLGNCLAPCEGLQKETEYLAQIDLARNILKGKLAVVEYFFKKEMKKSAENLEFEKAQVYKNNLELMSRFQTNWLVTNRKFTDIDVITITSTPTEAFTNFMKLIEGAIVFSKNIIVKKKLEETDAEIITTLAHQLRMETNPTNTVLLSNLAINITNESFVNIVPEIGDKRKLVELSLKNALYLKSKHESKNKTVASKKTDLLYILQKDLELKQLPVVIECFDNSNLQGTSPVASMVRFVNGRPEKREYRHYNIKTVIGANDFASMKEIVFRRYSRLKSENIEMPNLIIVDGGKGQLSSAIQALQELGLFTKIPIIGIAKKLEAIYRPNEELPLLISKKSYSLKLIQQIRNEAHRFAITFHRKKRSNSALKGELETIEGIGTKTINVLLSHFKSVRKIKIASISELEPIIGKSKTVLISRWQKKELRQSS